MIDRIDRWFWEASGTAAGLRGDFVSWQRVQGTHSANVCRGSTSRASDKRSKRMTSKPGIARLRQRMTLKTIEPPSRGAF